MLLCFYDNIISCLFIHLDEFLQYSIIIVISAIGYIVGRIQTEPETPGEKIAVCLYKMNHF